MQRLARLRGTQAAWHITDSSLLAEQGTASTVAGSICEQKCSRSTPQVCCVLSMIGQCAALLTDRCVLTCTPSAQASMQRQAHARHWRRCFSADGAGPQSVFFPHASVFNAPGCRCACPVCSACASNTAASIAMRQSRAPEMREGDFHHAAEATLESLQEMLEQFVDERDIDGGDVEYGVQTRA